MSKYITLPLSSFLQECALFESTITDLQQSTYAAFPLTKKRQHVINNVRITSYTMLPGENSLTIKAVARNPSSKSVNYPSIQFDGIEYVDETNPEAVQFTASDGTKYYMLPMKQSSVQVKIRCECMDFYWRFALWNHNDGSLLGQKPEPYVKQTNRPPANPKQSPGMCKHLLKLVEYLRSVNIIQ